MEFLWEPLLEKKVMNLATKTFISSAFWTERLGPACALTFIKKHKKINLGTKLIKTGKKIKKFGKMLRIILT